MRDVFEGIRVKEFVLFEGEELECFTEETAPDGTKTTSGHRFLKAARIPEELKDSRFALISRMSEMKQRGDDEALAEELIRFRQLDSLTRELFTLI